MARTCERPTCSQPAEVTYGIDPYALVVCLEAFDDVRSRRAGVLCRDHADSMVVPNGWTLDDRRESAPRLFQSRESAKSKPARRVRRQPLTDDDTGQLRLVVPEGLADDQPANSRPTTDKPATDKPTAGEPTTHMPAAGEPWQPVFDQADDLDGLLAARSPLLSRAFGKDKRKKENGARPATPKG